MVARTYASSEQYRFGFNGKEHEDDITGGYYDFDARIYDSRIARWLAVDPHFFTYRDWSPYVFAADRPTTIKDEDGKDWVITTIDDGNGNISVHIYIKAAVVNSSANKSIDMVALQASIKSQIEGIYCYSEVSQTGQLHITTTLDIRVVANPSEIKQDEHTFELVNPGDPRLKAVFKDGTIVIAPARAMSGTHIIINSDHAESIIKNLNVKTMAHELGHTGGLRHPAPDMNIHIIGGIGMIVIQ